jgi:cysteine synthase A
MSEDRRSLPSAFGAEVVLTDADAGMDGAISAAVAIVDRREAVHARQFENIANPAIHRETPGPEIRVDTDGQVDAIVAGVGTGGTITGVAEYLQESVDSDVRTVAVEPAASPVLSGGEAGSHSIQGIGAELSPRWSAPN